MKNTCEYVLKFMSDVCKDLSFIVDVDFKLPQKYQNSLLYKIKSILQNGACFVLGNNTLNYFAVYYLKSKCCCFAAF